MCCNPTLHVCRFNVECLIKANGNRRFVQKQKNKNKNKNSIPWNFKSFLGQTHPSLAVSFWIELCFWFTHLMVKNNSEIKIAGQPSTRLPCSRLLEAFSGLADGILRGSSHPFYHFFKTLPLGRKLKTAIEKKNIFSINTYKWRIVYIICCIFSMFCCANFILFVHWP